MLLKNITDGHTTEERNRAIITKAKVVITAKERIMSPNTDIIDQMTNLIGPVMKSSTPTTRSIGIQIHSIKPEKMFGIKFSKNIEKFSGAKIKSQA